MKNLEYIWNWFSWLSGTIIVTNIYIYIIKNVKITQYNLFNNVPCVQREDIASAWFYTIIHVGVFLSNYNFV